MPKTAVQQIAIIGAGHGGVQAVASLRQEGFRGKIILISGESGLPYQRPPLSKAFLKNGSEAGLQLRPATFYERNEVDIRVETRVEAIERDAMELRTSRGPVPYDRLILATGARNLRPPIEGLNRAYELRTLDDAKALYATLSAPRRCVVIGGGFIGLEFATVARSLGFEVTVVEAAARPMARAVSPTMSSRFLDLHRSMGTVIELGHAVTAVTESSVVLADGRELPADLALLAAGIAPNNELAMDAGLDCKNGIRTDAFLRTSDPAISALGDCASFPDPRTGRSVRLESVQAATDHARTIAKNIVHGNNKAYDALPWFWSDQSNAKLQIVGLAGQEDEEHVLPNGAVLRFDGDALSAVETVNDAKTHMQFRKIMGKGLAIQRNSLLYGADDLIAI